MKNNRGFTLTEILIAFGIFTVFLTGVVMVFRSGSASFVLGSWKTNAQKKSQIFLGQLRGDLENANNPIVISTSTVEFLTSTPIYINTNAYADNNAAPKQLSLTTTAWTPLMFFSICKSQVQSTIFSPGKSGKWLGVSLWAKERKILYTHSNDHAQFTTVPTTIPGGVSHYMPPGGVGAGKAFEPSPDNVFSNVMIEDVESIGFQRKIRNTEIGSPGVVLEIKLFMRRSSGGSDTETVVQENTDAKIMSQIEIATF